MQPFRPGIESVSNTNFLTRIVSTLSGKLNFLGVARNCRLNDFLHDAWQTAGCVTMHTVGPLQFILCGFRGAVLSNNDQPATTALGVGFRKEGTDKQCHDSSPRRIQSGSIS